jgi:hypothetical protein
MENLKNIFRIIFLPAMLIIPLSLCVMSTEINKQNNSDQITGSDQKTRDMLDDAANLEGLPVVVANTTYGLVAGLMSDDGLNVFLGIPYARAPEGELRFEPPQDPPSWNGILPAFNFGPVCPQVQAAPFPPSYYPQNEDCLSLNIWTPGVDSKRRPVLVSSTAEHS